MPSSIRKRIEIGANVAIICVAILLGIALIRNLRHQHTQQAAEKLKSRRVRPELVGKKTNIPGVDWGRNERTLVLALQPQCKFCTESAPFYKQLVEKYSTRSNVKLMVVSPAPVTSTQKYLETLSVSISEVKQIPMDVLGLSGTPSLLLIDKTGTVTNFWLGKLRSEHETEVIAQLQ